MKKKSRIIVSSRLKPSLWRACAAVLAGLGGAHADSFYWSGDASLFWNAPVSGLNGTNWSSSPDFNNPTIGAGALPGSNDDVFFNLFDATNLATTLGAEFSIRSLAFTPDATNPVSIGGTHALTIGLGGITDNSPAAITLSAPVVLGSSQTWTNQSSNAFTVSGNVSGAASSNLTLAGSGIFNLTGANSYAGSTTLFTGSMTLSGAGTLAGTSGVTLNAGTTLLLDNTTANVSDRLANTVTITSRGGTVALLGNGATPTVENIGMLTVGSGASTIRVSGATLGLGAAGTLPGLARLRGGTVVFQPTAGGSIITPNTALSNGIIGGWALTSNGTGNGVDWATTGNLGAVVPFTDYQPFSAGSLPEENAKFDASVTGSVAITSNLSVNSLYLTGASTPVSDVSGTPASYIANGTGSATPVRAYYNGITFGTGSGAGSTVVLTIGSGGIISSGATGVGYYNNKANVENMAFIGYLFDESGGSTGRITSGNGSDLIVYTESNLRIAANIVNNGATPIGLTKSGPGILDLSNGNNQNNKAGNSFSGKVVINEGILTISREDQLGTSNSGGYVADAITFNGGELLTYAGTNFAASRGFTVGTRGGVVAYTGGGNTLVQAKITGPGGFSLYSRQTGGGGGQTMRFAIPTVGGVAASDYQGSTNLWLGYADGGTGAGGSSTGVLRFDLPNQLPATSAVNANMVDDTREHNVVPNITNSGVDLNGTAQAFGSLAGNLNFNNHNGALILGANNLSTLYTGRFNTGTGSITKIGTGTQTFSGANLYTGATNINGGTLLIGNGLEISNPAASLGTSNVTVGNGVLTGTLGGNGRVNGAVTVTSTGHLAPAMTPSTSNTLTLGNNLTLNAGATLDFNFGSAGTGGAGSSDRVNVGGNLLLNAGADVLNITQLPNFGIGTYTLFTVANGSFTNNATFTINGNTNFNYAILRPGDLIDPAANGGITGATVPAKQLWLQVLQGNPNLTWLGGINGSWDINTTANWGGASTRFSNGANLTFDDTATGPATLTVAAGGVAPNSIIFNNTGAAAGGKDYILGGGSITVTAGAGITKNQAGNVTFNSDVTTPITTLNGGGMIVGAGTLYSSTAKVDVNSGTTLSVNGTLGSPAINIKAGATLQVTAAGALTPASGLNVSGAATFNHPTQSLAALSGASGGTVLLNGTALTVSDTSLFDGVLSGSGSLTKSTGGVLTLSNGANSYTGGTTISGGTLIVTNPAGSATGTGAILIQPGGTLGGTGRVAGNVISGGILAPGNGGIGTLTLGQGLTINSGAGFEFDIAAPGSHDTINVTGALLLAGTETFHINALTGFTPGSYTLLTAAGGLTNNASFSITHAGPGDSAGLVYNLLAAGNQLLLNVEVASRIWKGGVNGTWDFATANWSANPYTDLLGAKFDDTGLNPNINIATPVAPTALLFTNNSVPYIVGGAAIGGTGTLSKSGSGSVTLTGANSYTGATTITGGVLNISADNNIGAAPLTPTPNGLTLNGGTLSATATFTLDPNRGMAVGASTGTLDVSAGALLTYAGIIANAPAQTGILAKSGEGQLDLNGANTFSGGIQVNGGSLRLGNATAAGTGVVTVNPTATLSLGADIGTGIVLAGGTMGASGANRTINGNLTAASGTTSTVNTFDPIAQGGGFDTILLGVLGGSGNIKVETTASNRSPDTAAFRLRGTGASDFSGTITVGNAAKFELQTSVAGPFSPAGTGKIVLTGGELTGAVTGTFSLINVRNNSNGNTIFGNDFEIAGTGAALINNISNTANLPAGTIAGFNNLTIGDNQILGVIRQSGTAFAISFNSVTLKGSGAGPGISTFTPGNIASGYPGVGDLILGPISETATAAGSGIVMEGTAVLTLAGANTYTGPTLINSGTIRLGATGALPATTVLTIEDGTVDLNNNGASFDQTISSLAGSGPFATLLNSDETTTRTLTVNQNSSTSFAGSLSGNLALVKSGTGTLQLLGASSHTGPTTISAGTLNVGSDLVRGSISASPLTIEAGAVLAGYGTVGKVTALSGARIAPGTGTGILSANNLSLQAGARLSMELNKALSLQPPIPGTDHDQVTVSDATGGATATLTLGGELFLTPGAGIEVGDIFTLLLNNGNDAVNGQFSGLANNTLFTADGYGFRISYFDNSATAAFETSGPGNDVSVLLVTVPEPGSWIALAGGAAGILGLRRFRRTGRC